MRHKFHTLRHSGKEVPDGTSASRISIAQRDSGQARMTNSENNSRGEGGQTLIEVLLALGVAVVIITAITSVVIVALDNASFSKNQNLANAYAQEGMEILREIRDRSWTEFDNLFPAPNRCLAQNSKTIASRSGANCAGEGDIFVGGTQFIRGITLQPNNPQCRPPGLPIDNHKVTVAVRWPDGKCPTCTIDSDCPTGNTFCHQARLVSCLGKKSNVVAP